MIIKICEFCGKEFSYRSKGKKRDGIRKFCSKKCFGKFLIGKPSPISGKKWSEESRDKIRGRTSWNKGIKCPEISKSMIGEKNHEWKGGISLLQNIIRSCSKYDEWKAQVRGRDNWTCQQCGARGIWMEAHHIKQFSDLLKKYNIKLPEEALICESLWDLDNGITYCLECHKLLKNKGGLL